MLLNIDEGGLSCMLVYFSIFKSINFLEVDLNSQIFDLQTSVNGLDEAYSKGELLLDFSFSSDVDEAGENASFEEESGSNDSIVRGSISKSLKNTYGSVKSKRERP